MTRLEEYKHKRKAALIGVCTLGLAGLAYVGVGNTWRGNIFQGASLSQNEGLGFILKILSFMLLSVLLAIPFFIISLIQLIYYSIKISELEGLQQQYHNRPMGTPSSRTNTIDIFTATYYYRENNQLYGPLTIEDLAVMDIRANTALAVNNPNNWKYAGDIPDLMETLRYVQN
ncbi:MAG: DUF4339 domain-containing protein [Dysgonamonadaceae bacterium]|jgi:hypothetical protein|nr:DUF4339 domain-containing protein [Dysgonamonadaceae bacterium]